MVLLPICFKVCPLTNPAYSLSYPFLGDKLYPESLGGDQTHCSVVRLAMYTYIGNKQKYTLLF